MRITRSSTTRGRKFTMLKRRRTLGKKCRSTSENTCKEPALRQGSSPTVRQLDLLMIQTCRNCGTKNRVNEVVALAHTPICGKCGASLDAQSNGQPQIVSDASFAEDVIAASS